MYRRALAVLAIGTIALSAAGMSPLADVIIRLKDGRVITVPVEADQVDAVTVVPSPAAESQPRPADVPGVRPQPRGLPEAPMSPAARAAQQIRESDERARALSAAAEAAEAELARAKRAAEGAERALRDTEAARAKAQAAADAAVRARETMPGGEARAPDAAPPADPAPQAATPPTPPTPTVPPGSGATAAGGAGTVLRVGASRMHKRPSDVARTAKQGDIIEIDAGVYEGDVVVWTQNNVTLRGVGGKVELKAAGAAAEEKAIWVIRGNNVIVENIEFSGARVPDKNGAGIRSEGAGLTVRNCKFYDNEMGFLSGNSPSGDILIENSEFYANTVDYERYRSLGHNVYVGGARTLTIRGSYLHHAHIGHNLKSRAKTSYILHNRIMDEEDGSASYLIDLEGGGIAYIVGNVIQKGVKADNWSVINFATASRSNDDRLYVVNNTIVIDRSSGQFVQNRSTVPAYVANNILVGKGTPIAGPGRLNGNLIVASAEAGGFMQMLGNRGKAEPGTGALAGNWIAGAAGLANARGYDYRLTPGSPAIDRGADIEAESNAFIPRAHYVHPARSAPRVKIGPIDIGAYEYEEGK